MSLPKSSIAGAALLATALLAAPHANAVRLDPEAGGQVLIYPYYTVRSYGTDPYNTYISIVNTSADAKALRMYFREGKAGLSALQFNLFLSPNDTWTGALVPSPDGGTQLITRDASCVSPVMPLVGVGTRGAPFRNIQFPGDSLDRTREGYAEVIEMGTLAGAALAAISQDANGVPHNCADVQGASYVPPFGELRPPSGGLQGTLTLINVASGMDFTVNAEALADFMKEAFYSVPSASRPDLSNADPVSVVTTPTQVYRLDWSNGLDAVSSALMQFGILNEYVLDPATASSSDWILTLPTRSAYVSSSGAQAPFTGSGGAPACEFISVVYFNRESEGSPPYGSGGTPPPRFPLAMSCNATSVWSVANTFIPPYQGDFPPPARPLFGSANGTTNGPSVFSEYQNGWAIMYFTGTNAVEKGLVSRPSSSRTDLVSGSVTTGPARVLGVPAIGFFARSFLNGLLKCSSGTCQGAYGSAFRHRSRRFLTAP